MVQHDGTGESKKAGWNPSEVFSGERMVPDRTDHGNVVYHTRRYQFARGLAKGKRVLDAGCGIGYGSEMLAEVADSVVAVDYKVDTVLYARDKYGRPNVRYAVDDVTCLGFCDASFDLVVSLEVFEHVRDAESYLSEICRVLKPGGQFVMSTPNQVVDEIHMKAIGVECEYHVNLASLSRLKDLLQPRYRRVEFYGLRRKGNFFYTFLRGLDIFNLRLRLLSPSRREQANQALGTPSMSSLSTADVVVSRWQARQANHVIVVATKST